MFCVQPESQFTGNVTVAPSGAGLSGSLSCHHFKISDGNSSANPGTDFIYSNPKPAPTTATSTGEVGTIRWDADHLYVATATDTWKTIPLHIFQAQRNIKVTEYYRLATTAALRPTIGTNTEVVLIGWYGTSNVAPARNYHLNMPANPVNGQTLRLVGNAKRDSALTDCTFYGNGSFFHLVRHDNWANWYPDNHLTGGTFDSTALGYSELTLPINSHSFEITYWADTTDPDTTQRSARWYVGSTGNIHLHTHPQTAHD